MSDLACPVCGTELDMAALFSSETDQRALARLAAVSIPLGTRVLQYITLFQPPKTRLTAAKLKASQAYAAKTGVAAPQHVLLPRPKGFVASVQGLRSHVRAVYSLTLIYDQPTPSLVTMVRGDVKRVRLHIKRTEISSMPTSEQDLASWLNADFSRKDALIGAAASER